MEDLTGPADCSVVVETSGDLLNWLPLWTNTFIFPAALNFNAPRVSIHPFAFTAAHLP